MPALRWLVNSAHELVAVVTQPDRPAGRGKKSQPTPVAARAEVEGLERIERCPDVNDESFVHKIKELNADLGVVAAFGQKMNGPIREAFGNGCVNLHASLLPKFRGAAPINCAILAGEKKTGVTTFRVVQRMDAGPILIRRETMIGPDETAEELHDRLAGIACDALGATLELLEREPDVPGQEQDESAVTKAPKLGKADGWLDFSAPAEAVALRVRAMWAWPGARCRYESAAGKSEEVIVATAAPLPVESSEPAGTLTSVLTVSCGQGTLEIHGIKPAGGRLMSWQDFVNGRHVKAADRMVGMNG